MDPLKSLFWVILVAALAPIVARVLPGRLPAVVFMIIGGVVIGPEVLANASPDDMSLLSTLGLSFLFLLAGYELEPTLMRQPPGKIAIRSWFVSAALSLAVTALLYQAGIINDFVEIAIALTTTALGTLLPILRDAGVMDGPLGPYVFAAGAVGEFFPIVAMALLLTSSGPIGGLFALFGMAAATLIALLIIRWVKRKGWGEKLRLPEDATGQTTLRWTLVLLAGLVLAADDFGLDVVLGAFLAGVVLRQWAPVSAESLERKLEAVGYGVFIPIFFVTSGMKLDIISILENPLRLLLFFVLLFAVRGLPQLFMYRGQLDRVQRWQMVFLTATALPLLVALADVGTESGLMLPENAAALVGAGALSVLVFPLVATTLKSKSTATSVESATG
ncbi:MAG: cation:proton antiporter [Candidatus Nanopelagicales bacterium]